MPPGGHVAAFTPQTFGRYLLMERIATGGMAEVYKAKSFGVEGFEKLLVIKRILPHLSRNPRFVSMFINEAKIAVSLSHVNIGQVFHLGREGEDYFISMEFIHGRDITQILRRCRELGQMVPVPLAIYLMSEVARGLDYAHRTADSGGNPSPVIHRDISSQNVLISFEGEVKIVDFGIARLASQLDDGEKRVHLAGKVAYMSPEQASGGVLDTRSDLFSLGCVLYELLTGTRMYQAATLQQKLELARDVRLTPPRTLRHEIPELLEDIVLKVLARRPEDRHQSAAELYEDLTEFLFRTGIRVTSSDVAQYMKELFAAHLAQEATTRELRAAVGSMDRMGRPASERSRPRTAPGSQEVPTVTGVEKGRPQPPSVSLMLSTAAEGVRRHLVVLLAEPLGLTDMASHGNDERYLRVSLELLKVFTRIVVEHGGQVDRWLNDRLWAVWGLTRASEHDTDAGLDCARALQEQVAVFNRTHGTGLSLAVALHRGLALVGGGSGDESWRYTPLGDVIKLPERMLGEASRGDVLVSEEIPASATTFSFEEGPTFRTSWGRGQHTSHRLTGVRSLRERSPRPHGRGRDVWIQRGQELEVARDALRLLRQGEGQVLHLVGEPGVGKSRFLEEIGRLIHQKEIAWVGGSCRYRTRDTPMAVFRDMMMAGCRIEQSDPPPTRWEKLQRLLELGLSPLDLQHISELVGAGAGAPGDGAERKDGLFRTLRRVVRGFTRDRPAIYAIENLQWMDPTSLELMQDIVESPPSGRLLVILTCRPDFKPPWASTPGVSEIHLGRLEMDGTAALIRASLHLDDVPAALIEGLYLRSDGNPLHLEQLMRVLQESGRLKVENGHITHLQLERGPAVPFTLQGLINSRIDALSDPERQLVHLASVGGRQMDLQLLSRASGRELDQVTLQPLVDKGLLEVAVEEGRLRFQNHLTWEAAYQGVVPRVRRALHRKLAECMEELYGEAADPEELYHHLMEGGLQGRAARFAEAAADRYQAKYFLSKAMDFYAKAIELLHEQDDLSEAGALPQLGHLYVKLGRLQVLTGERTDAQTTFERGLDVASELEDARLEAFLLCELGKLKGEIGDRYLAQNYLELALENAEALQDPALQADILESLGSFYLQRGLLDEARTSLERGLDVASQLAAPRLVGQLLIRLGDLHMRTGDYALALERNQLCLLLAQDSGDRILLGRALNNIGNAWVAQGQFDEALECYRRSIDVRKGIGYLRGIIVNYHNIGELFFSQGKYGRAYAYFQESLQAAAEYRWPQAEGLNLAYMGYIEAVKGDPEGLRRLRRADESARSSGDVKAQCTAAYLTGRYLFEQGDREQAQSCLQTAMSLVHTLHERVLEDRISRLLREIVPGNSGGESGLHP